MSRGAKFQSSSADHQHSCTRNDDNCCGWGFAIIKHYLLCKVWSVKTMQCVYHTARHWCKLYLKFTSSELQWSSWKGHLCAAMCQGRGTLKRAWSFHMFGVKIAEFHSCHFPPLRRARCALQNKHACSNIFTGRRDRVHINVSYSSCFCAGRAEQA